MATATAPARADGFSAQLAPNPQQPNIPWNFGVVGKHKNDATTWERLSENTPDAERHVTKKRRLRWERERAESGSHRIRCDLKGCIAEIL